MVTAISVVRWWDLAANKLWGLKTWSRISEKEAHQNYCNENIIRTGTGSHVTALGLLIKRGMCNFMDALFKRWK